MHFRQFNSYLCFQQLSFCPVYLCVNAYADRCGSDWKWWCCSCCLFCWPWWEYKVNCHPWLKTDVAISPGLGITHRWFAVFSYLLWCAQWLLVEVLSELYVQFCQCSFIAKPYELPCSSSVWLVLVVAFLFVCLFVLLIGALCGYTSWSIFFLFCLVNQFGRLLMFLVLKLLLLWLPLLPISSPVVFFRCYCVWQPWATSHATSIALCWCRGLWSSYEALSMSSSYPWLLSLPGMRWELCACMYMCTCVGACGCVCACECVCVCIHVCVCVCVCLCLYMICMYEYEFCLFILVNSLFSFGPFTSMFSGSSDPFSVIKDMLLKILN